MRTFKAGQIIELKYMPNSDMPIIEERTEAYEVLSRTKCFVTLKNLYNEKVKRCKIKSWDGCESETTYFNDYRELTA